MSICDYRGRKEIKRYAASSRTRWEHVRRGRKGRVVEELLEWPENIYVCRPDIAAKPQIKPAVQHEGPDEAAFLHAKMLEFMALREKAVENGMTLYSDEEINAEVAKLRADGASDR